MSVIYSVMILYAFVGWVVGVALAVRTLKIPRHQYPGWRKLSKVSWIIWIVGVGAQVIGMSVMIIGLMTVKDALSPPMLAIISLASLLWGLTLVCPILWIVAWFQARQATLPAVQPHLPREVKEGTWPPPPTIGPVDP